MSGRRQRDFRLVLQGIHIADESLLGVPGSAAIRQGPRIGMSLG